MREQDPQLARATVIELRQGIRKLKQFPRMGPPGREEGTREPLETRLPHIIAYRVKDDTVEILHI